MTRDPIDPADLMETPLGDIAVQMPGATALFKAVDLDYCCGGRLTLKAAAQAASVDLDRLLSDLLALQPGDTVQPTETDTPALIDMIIERYHRVHSQELPELIRLAGRIEEVHRNHPSVPTGLAALLQRMLGELTIHMQKEELVLFPRLKKGDGSDVTPPITAMMADHDDHGELLREVNALTDSLRVPEGGCATWRALYAGLTKLSDDLIAHIHTENNILFPRFLGVTAEA